MRLIAEAVEHYHTTYHRFPVSKEIQSAADSTGSDFAFENLEEATPQIGDSRTRFHAGIMAAILDLTNSPASGAAINSDHNLNPLAIRFLNARLVPDSRSPGVGTDLVYRDPWGNPYMITMDLNGDGRCRDPFYQMNNVSRDHGATGFNNVTNCDDSLGQSDAFEYLGGVMVWSHGPDGKADQLKPANVPPNKDNVLDWVR